MAKSAGSASSKLKLIPNYMDYCNKQTYGYRFYQSLEPSCSRYLQLRWDTKKYDDHCKRVSSAKPTVNTQPPMSFLHIHVNWKKLQMNQDRVNEIMRDNETLLNRMSHAIHKEQRLPVVKTANKYKSLNYEQRKAENMKIMEENHKMLHRIVTKNANYNSKGWQEEWHTSRRYLKSLSTYPAIK
ncbi:hypothetical protein CHUAL_010965 [Chamberlinius hualienensis]